MSSEQIQRQCPSRHGIREIYILIIIVLYQRQSITIDYTCIYSLWLYNRRKHS